MVDGTQGSHRKEGSTKMTKHSRIVAGIDISKAKLDVAVSIGKAGLQVDNDASGYRKLVTWLHQEGIELVGLEASGGYERRVAAYLRDAGFTVHVLQPIQVRAFAMFCLQRAKNDKIDARLIAVCTAASPSDRAAPDPRFDALAEMLTLLEQIEEDMARAKTRREAFHDQRHQDLLDAEIKRLRAWRTGEIKHLLAELRRHKDLAHRLALIESVPGIGTRTALAVLIRMPEIGTLSREQAAALAGLAPFDQDSGQHQGRRRIAGGRKRLRKSLYAAALPAAFRWNPALINLYRRLIENGKTHKATLVACARKLLIFANAVVARGTPWTKANHAT